MVEIGSKVKPIWKFQKGKITIYAFLLQDTPKNKGHSETRFHCVPVWRASGGWSTLTLVLPSRGPGPRNDYRILVEILRIEVEFLGSLVITVTLLLCRPFLPAESKTTLTGTISPGATTILEGLTAVHPQEERILRITSSRLPLLVSSKVYSFLSPCLIFPKS